MKYQFSLVKAIGGRDNQEDSCALQTPFTLHSPDDEGFVSGKDDKPFTAIMCDGMGGHASGEVASLLAMNTFLDAVDTYHKNKIRHDEMLFNAAAKANDALSDAVKTNKKLKGMGTTLTAIHCEDYKINWYSVGDSHLFLYRDKNLIKLNQDHSMRPVIEAMVEKGIISKEEAMSHPDKNALRSVMMGDKLDLFDTGVDNFSLQKHDILILASDGLDSVPMQTMLKHLKSSWFNTVEKMAKNIVAEALKIGGKHQDNTCVIVIAIK